MTSVKLILNYYFYTFLSLLCKVSVLFRNKLITKYICLCKFINQFSGKEIIRMFDLIPDIIFWIEDEKVTNDEVLNNHLAMNKQNQSK